MITVLIVAIGVLATAHDAVNANHDHADNKNQADLVEAARSLHDAGNMREALALLHKAVEVEPSTKVAERAIV